MGKEERYKRRERKCFHFKVALAPEWTIFHVEARDNTGIFNLSLEQDKQLKDIQCFQCSN